MITQGRNRPTTSDRYDSVRTAGARFLMSASSRGGRSLRPVPGRPRAVPSGRSCVRTAYLGTHGGRRVGWRRRRLSVDRRARRLGRYSGGRPDRAPNRPGTPPHQRRAACTRPELTESVGRGQRQVPRWELPVPIPGLLSVGDREPQERGEGLRLGHRQTAGRHLRVHEHRAGIRTGGARIVAERGIAERPRARGLVGLQGGDGGPHAVVIGRHERPTFGVGERLIGPQRRTRLELGRIESVPRQRHRAT